MDEPTSSLTLSETERLMQVVADLRANGVSVVYISHRLDEVERLADRVVVLRDGRNAGELRRGEISKDRMVQLMVGRDLKAFFAEPAATRGNVCLELRGLRTGRYRGASRFSFPSSRRDSGSRRSYRRGTFRAGSDGLWSRRSRGGEVLLDGALLNIRSPQDAIRHGIYLVPEDRRNCGLLTGMSVRENITLPNLSRFSAGGLDKPAEGARRSAGSRVRN